MTSRRTFLKGLGTAALASTALASLPALADDARPRRLLVIHTGAAPWASTFWPSAPGPLVGATFHQAATQPLRGFRSSDGTTRDFTERVAFVDNLDSVVGLMDAGEAGHHFLPYLLTGVPMTRAVDASGATRRAGAGAASFDQILADSLGPAPVRSIHARVLYGEADGNQSGLVWSGPDRTIASDASPAALFARLFPGWGAGADRRVRRAAVLDVLRGRLDAFRGRVAAADRELVDRHRAQVEELAGSLSRADAALIDPGSLPGEIAMPGDPAPMNGFPIVARAHLDVIAHAFATDTTRVATLSLADHADDREYTCLGANHTTRDTAGGVFVPPEGYPANASCHSLQHSIGDPMAQQLKTDIDQLHVGLYAHALDVLARTPDGTGTLLDHTVVLMLSSHDVGGHWATRLGCVVAGGGIVGGQCVQAAPGTSHTRVLTTVARACGVSLESFGDPRVSSSAIEEMLAA